GIRYATVTGVQTCALPILQEHHLAVAKTARYYSLGEPGPATRQLWYVCHGYGQLAGRFLRHFEPLDDGSRVIIAPEGLSRFYLRSEERRVGKGCEAGVGRG